MRNMRSANSTSFTDVSRRPGPTDRCTATLSTDSQENEWPGHRPRKEHEAGVFGWVHQYTMGFLGFRV